jgi:hypothetical protein
MFKNGGLISKFIYHFILLNHLSSWLFGVGRELNVRSNHEPAEEPTKRVNDTCSASQDIPRLLCNLKINCGVNNSPCFLKTYIIFVSQPACLVNNLIKKLLAIFTVLSFKWQKKFM